MAEHGVRSPEQNKQSEIYGIFRREIVMWLVGAGIFCAASVTIAGAFDSLRNVLFQSWNCSLLLFSLIFSLAYFLFLLISALFCKKWQEVYDDKTLPGCTVLVPAYNEGKHVFDTVCSLLQSDYPADRLHIIAINDGSEDDTLMWLEKAGQLSGQISIINLENNRGKKYALYQGIQQAADDFIVTVDSDSIVRRDTVRQLMQPFCDTAVAAVAGSITGKRMERNYHVRLLDVMLVFGCEFLRRAQSSSGNVFCTPGALSAYRRSCLLAVADEWLNQTFMGQPAKIGEDRAIATLLLRSGHKIVHQCTALAETCLPENYCGVCRMLLRWTRSDIRENILMTPQVLKKLVHPDGRALCLFIHWFALFVNMLLPLIFIPVGIYLLCTAGYIHVQLAMICVSSVLWGFIPAVVYWKNNSSLCQTIWAFAFAFYSLLALSWITIYSVFTINNSKWMTREIRK